MNENLVTERVQVAGICGGAEEHLKQFFCSFVLLSPLHSMS